MFKILESIYNYLITLRGADSDTLETLSDQLDGTALASSWTAALATILANFTAIRIGYLDELDFDLTAAIAAIPTTMVGTDGAALASAWTAALATALGNYTAVRAGYIDNIAATAKGMQQVLEVSVTSAANAGVTTVATVATQPCIIEGIIIHADATQTTDMTSCAIEGGVSQVVEFIGAGSAVQANLSAADEQVAWSGIARLAVGKIISIDLQGTGATAVDLTIIIIYRASIDGGVLS